MNLGDLASRMGGIHQKIVDDVPALKRGMVWCRECGRSEKVDAAECLRSGWPKCCGYTMTIDDPAGSTATEGGEE